MATFQAGHAKVGGRKAGVPNKATAEIRSITAKLFDEAYWTQTRRRLMSGRIAPAVEAKLLAYAFGEPKQTFDVPGLQNVAEALARKVIHQLQPGPTKAA